MRPEDLSIATHVSYVFQLGLGVVFLLSAVPKLRAPGGAVDTVAGYRLLPAGAAPVAAAALIGVESFLAVALLTGVLTGVAVLLAFLTLLAFAAAVWVNLRRGQRVPCGCFGNPDEKISGRVLARLLLLLASAALLLGLRSIPGARAVSVGSLAAWGWSGMDYAVAMASLAAFLVLTGLWILNLPELLSVTRHARQAGRSMG